MMTPSFSLPFDVAIVEVLSPFASAETEGVECLFDLVLVAARILCSRDDRMRLNVLSWTSGLAGDSEALDDVDTELSLGSGSRAMLKGLDIPSCARRCRTADVMYVGHLRRWDGEKIGGLQSQCDDGDEQDLNL